MTDYQERLVIPVEGDSCLELKTAAGLLVARGYRRIVIGECGPYIEFETNKLIQENIHIPEDQEWRLDSENAYYNEYRTNCSANVKIYHQKKTVDYADYLVGYWYISPFELITDKHAELVKPAKKKPANRLKAKPLF